MKQSLKVRCAKSLWKQDFCPVWRSRYGAAFLTAAALLLASSMPAIAQFAAGQSSGGPSAVILPSSGRSNQGGSVNAAEQPVPGTTTSVNTINPTVQISGPYGGSARSTAAIPFSGKLSLEEALRRGLTFNLGAVGVEQNLRQLRGQVGSTRSALLPNVNGSLNETVEQVDLAALGFRISIPFPGFQIPAVVGPFNYYSLQASLTQTVANMTSLNNYRAARASARAGQYSAEDARDLVTLAVGGAYLQVLAAQSRLDAAQAQLTTANAVLHQSTEQHAQGVLGRLGVDQNQVRDLTQQQRMTTLRNDLAKQKINLARLTGLPPTPDYELTDVFPFAPAPVQSVTEALAKAEQQRSDLKAAQAQVEAAQRALSAARAERLPSLSVSADYEFIGPNPGQTHTAYTAAGTLNIPIWQGGRVGSDIAQAEAVLAQRRAELEDMHGQIESEVRQTYLDLEAAAGQVELARKNLDVARETLDMTRARMEAGVVNTLEVVQAQETLSSAQLDLIDSVFAHNLAKLTLARAVGHASDQIFTVLKSQPAPVR